MLGIVYIAAWTCWVAIESDVDVGEFEAMRECCCVELRYKLDSVI